MRSRYNFWRLSPTVRLSLGGIPALAFLGVCAGTFTAGDSSLPFAIGERLTYEVRLSKGSKVGTATMWVEGPVDVRGYTTYLLRFDSQIRYLFVPAVSRSSS